MRKKEIGNLGEAIAAQYLQSKGWLILGNNVDVPGGEIDLITREAKTGILVFVEVKSRSGRAHPGFKPEDLYSWQKAKTTRRSCQWYAGKYPKVIFSSGWRIDLLTIQINQLPLTDYEKDCFINHFQNVG